MTELQRSSTLVVEKALYKMHGSVGAEHLQPANKRIVETIVTFEYDDKNY
jgi:hypothetical protein